MAQEHFQSLKGAIECAAEIGLLERVKGLEGFSGEKLLGCLQRCARHQDESNHGHYLEIGVYRGLSLLTVARVLTRSQAIGVDNFSQFNPNGKNLEVIQKAIKSFGLENIRLLNQDYEDALESLGDHLQGEKIATYFVDGPHDYRSQLLCLNLVRPYLADRAIIFVDDSNYLHVRQANRDFLITNPEFRLFFEAYTAGHPNNLEPKQREEVRAGWWNGLNVIVKDVEGRLSRQYPPTERNRVLFEIEHSLQSDKHGRLAVEALELLRLLEPFKPYRVARYLWRLRKTVRNHDRQFASEYQKLNTFSEQIVGCRFNEIIQPDV